MLLACAKALNKPAEDQQTFARIVESASAAMNKELWDPTQGLFVAKAVADSSGTATDDSAGRAAGDSLASLMPFVSGPDVLTPEQDAALRRHLADATTFLSPSGLRSRSAKSAGYRAADPALGGVRFGTQWLVWKSLLDRGDAAHASDLAARVLAAYEKACSASGGSPEWLNADTGGGAGRLDSSGDACALIALQAAYHRPGTISCGWDVNLLDDLYDGAADSLRVVFRPVSSAPKGVILCVMGKPGAKYRAAGDIKGDFTADAGGVVTLPVPNDKTTQQVQISPVGTGN